MVFNNTKPVDQLILSSSLEEAGGGQGRVPWPWYIHNALVALLEGAFLIYSLCEVGGRPTIGYDNQHFRRIINIHFTKIHAFLSYLHQSRKMTNLFLPFQGSGPLMYFLCMECYWQ